MARPSGHRLSKSTGVHPPGFSKGPAHSKVQWRWMYATHQKFAHKWSEYIEATRGVKTGYHSLPERKGVRKATGSRLRG